MSSARDRKAQAKVSLESAINALLLICTAVLYFCMVNIGITTIEAEAIIIPGIEGLGISFRTNFFTEWNRTYRPSIKNVKATNFIALFSILSSSFFEIFLCCLNLQIKTKPDNDSTMLSRPNPTRAMLFAILPNTIDTTASMML